MNVAAIIVAAGASTRAGGSVPKPYRPLGDEPVLAHTIRSLLLVERITAVRVVIGEGHEEHFERVASIVGDARLLPPVAGGKTRGESVLAGLRSVASEHVIIHDGARPFPDPASVEALLTALQDNDAVFLALPVHDTLCLVDSEGKVSKGPDRKNVWRAQTPQGFRRDVILRAYEQAGTRETDDISLARMIGVDAVAVTGSRDNIKITVPGDFDVAEKLLARIQAGNIGQQQAGETSEPSGRRDRRTAGFEDESPIDQPETDAESDENGPGIRIGNGFDVHRFTKGDHVVLCGVRIPFDRSLEGHSDADVGLHAVTDALLGAIAAGDIGRWFPPSDPKWKGADSAVFLRAASEHLGTVGYRISNIDCTIICEAPKIAPHVDRMCERIAEITGISRRQVNVKATTTEGLGFPGRGEGIAAMATACVVRS